MQNNSVKMKVNHFLSMLLIATFAVLQPSRALSAIPETTYCMVVVQELKSDYFVGYIDNFGYVLFQQYDYSTFIDKGDIICGSVRSYGFQDAYDNTKNKNLRIYIEDYDMSKGRCQQWITSHDKWKETTKQPTDSYNPYRQNNTYCMVVVQELRSDYWVGYIENRGYVIFEQYGYTYIDKGDIICGDIRSYNFHDAYNNTKNKSIRIYVDEYDMTKDRCIEWITDHDKWKD